MPARPPPPALVLARRKHLLNRLGRVVQLLRDNVPLGTPFAVIADELVDVARSKPKLDDAAVSDLCLRLDQPNSIVFKHARGLFDLMRDLLACVNEDVGAVGKKVTSFCDRIELFHARAKASLGR